MKYLLLVFVVLLFVGCGFQRSAEQLPTPLFFELVAKQTKTVTRTPTATRTRRPTRTRTATPTRTRRPTRTATATSTLTKTPTSTPTRTFTPIPEPPDTSTPAPSLTPSITPTGTPQPTEFISHKDLVYEGRWNDVGEYHRTKQVGASYSFQFTGQAFFLFISIVNEGECTEVQVTEDGEPLHHACVEGGGMFLSSYYDTTKSATIKVTLLNGILSVDEVIVCKEQCT